MKLEREQLPYRQAVIGIVINKKRQFLIVQSVTYNANEWRFPGGGIENHETPEHALLRELKEELRNDKFVILKKSTHIIQYDWPKEIILEGLKKHGKLFRGQQQIPFFVKYTGDNDRFIFDTTEIRKIKWATQEELPNLFLFSHQMEETNNILKEFPVSKFSF